MATTTNYGWTTPDDTALVKDGASAIRTLGSSVDSTLKTQIDAQIPKTIVDAKGDLIAATAADTVSRLAVGTNGHVLTADSAEATGIKWAAPLLGGETLISTTTLTGSSTVISSIPTGYKHLRLEVQNAYGTAYDETWWVRLNADTAANYLDASQAVGATKITFGRITQSTTNLYKTQGILEIFDYTSTTTKFITTQSLTYETVFSTIRSNITRANYTTSSAISSITFFPNTGSISGGTALLYGVK